MVAKTGHYDTPPREPDEPRTDEGNLVCRDCLTHSTSEWGQVCPHCESTRIVCHEDVARLTIAHVDCDSFYASVEKRDDPSLADKPLIVGHAGGRGVVTTACYIARKFGPRSAMPMFKALQLCPQAVVIQPDMAKYKAVSQEIRAIFRDATDIVEPMSLDEAYLDLGPGMKKTDDVAAVHLARIAWRVEREVGITVSVGLSYNKFLAKLASDLDKPRGFSILGPGEAKAFLASLPVGRIHGVGRATEEKMARLGITRISQLQAMPPDQLVGIFGKFGHHLSAFVNGADTRKVTPSRPAKSISTETTFAKDHSDFTTLAEALDKLAERVATRLDRSELQGRTVVLKLKTADFQILTRNRRLTAPSDGKEIIAAAGRDLLQREIDGRAFRLIGIGLSDLSSRTEAGQQDLFAALGTNDRDGRT